MIVTPFTSNSKYSLKKTKQSKSAVRRIPLKWQLSSSQQRVNVDKHSDEGPHDETRVNTVEQPEDETEASDTAVRVISSRRRKTQAARSDLVSTHLETKANQRMQQRPTGAATAII